MITVLLSISLTSNAIEINGLNYYLNTDNSTAYITTGQSPTLTGTLTLPSSFSFLGSTYTIDSIAPGAFVNCPNLTSFDVSGNSFFSSEDDVLFNSNKTKLICCLTGTTKTSYIIPNSVTSIGESAFMYCTKLKSVTIPESIKIINKYTFFYCTSIDSQIIPNSVTSIGDCAFAGCHSLASIIIPSSVNSIGLSAFGECNTLTSIIIPNSVISIGNRAFSNCTELTSVVISNSIISIGEMTFSSCYKLSSFSIPNSVITIGEEAFSYCYSLSNISIGNSVSSIAKKAFYCCSNLGEVHCMSTTPPSCGIDVFASTKYTSGILFTPKDSKLNYTQVSPWKEFMMIVGEVVTEINSQYNNMKVFHVGSNLVIKGVNTGDLINIYNTNGVLVSSLIAKDETILLSIPSRAIYLIKIKDNIVKVAM